MPEKYLTIFSRIDKVLKDKGFVKKNGKPNYAEAERKCDIKGTVLSKLSQRKGDLGDYNREKFLRTFHVEPHWFDTGEGNIYVKEYVQEGTLPVVKAEEPQIEGIKPVVSQQEILKTTLDRAMIILDRDNEKLWDQNANLIGLIAQLSTGKSIEDLKKNISDTSDEYELKTKKGK